MSIHTASPSIHPENRVQTIIHWFATRGHLQIQLQGREWPSSFSKAYARIPSVKHHSRINVDIELLRQLLVRPSTGPRIPYTVHEYGVITRTASTHSPGAISTEWHH